METKIGKILESIETVNEGYKEGDDIEFLLPVFGKVIGQSGSQLKVKISELADKVGDVVFVGDKQIIGLA